MATLTQYLKTYKMTKEAFDSLVAKDKAFFDKYINWGNTDDETDISPKAIDRLTQLVDEEFNSVVEKAEKEFDGAVKNAEKFPWDTDGDTAAAVKKDSETYPWEDPLPAPVEKSEDAPSKKTDATTTENDATPAENDAPTAEKEPKKRGRKTVKSADVKPIPAKPTKKMISIRKNELTEKGLPNEENVRTYREFLIAEGMNSMEVALMSDQDVLNTVRFSFYLIESGTETYFIRRNALESILSDVFILENRTGAPWE